jgi:chemotaxis protein MotA
MLVIVGLLVVFGSVIGGYVMHHGQIGVLIQINEFIIIGGAAFGAMLAGNSMAVVKATTQRMTSLFKPSPYTKASYNELLLMLNELFQLAKKDGVLALEKHVENPHESDVFSKYPSFSKNHHAVDFVTDTIKVLLSGAVDIHALAEILEADIEQHQEEALTPSHVLTTVADAMPGFGIVAAVLGVIVTMGSIAGAASEIGEKVAAALVGTFVGILLAYGVYAPLAKGCENSAKAEIAYLLTIKTALLSFANGDPPVTAVEFARRSIEPGIRTSFSELEQMIKDQKGK